MKHSELRHQPRHVNPRIQVVRIVQYVKIVQLVQLDYYCYSKFFGVFVGTWGWSVYPCNPMITIKCDIICPGCEIFYLLSHINIINYES